jgi:DNA-binding CsgD family transcriptional regulator
VDPDMPEPQVKPFLQAMDRLYAAALDPGQWRPFLAATAAMFDADNAYVSQIEHNRRTLDYVVLRQVNWDAISVGRYAALMDEDPRMPAFRNNPLRAQHCRMVVPENKLWASRTYCEALRPLGIEYTLVVGVPEPAGVINYLGLTRNPSGEPFDEADCEMLEELVPHLARAFAVRRCLGHRSGHYITAKHEKRTPLPSVYGNGPAPIAVPAQPLAACEEDLLRQRFGLSPRQANLTALLLSGRSVKEAATALGVTEGSARQYLKLIFRKTGARRQADLVRLVSCALA